MKRKAMTVIVLMVTASLFLMAGCSLFDKKEEKQEAPQEPEDYGKAEITDVVLPGRDGRVRIKKGRKKNDIKVTFTLSRFAGQKVAFVDKEGTRRKDIAVDAERGDRDVVIETSLPDRRWMNRKKSVYRIKSFAASGLEESDIEKITIRLSGQNRYFDGTIEGSTVWYGGPGDAPPHRTGVILATDKENVYAADAYPEESGQQGGSGSGSKGGKRRKYKWKKADCMLNLADVRTDIVYDIYNAYSSRFFPIEGLAMYSDNGSPGLGRYDLIPKEDAVHKNRKTGKETFMVPVQWDFAPVIAEAQEKARSYGVTLYIADTFRPIGSVDPVAKEVDDAGLLAYGGTSAHNFGFAVDTGWQNVDENGEPAGEPFTKNLQALDRKLAVQGPNGNAREPWWDGVNKLAQEWWHYGDASLRAGYGDHARRVAALYVNKRDCPSEKRSSLR